MADPIFQARLENVQDDCENIAKYLSSDGTKTPRPWMVPAAVAGWTFDPTDIPNLGEPFDRTDVNQDYIDTLDTRDKTALAMAAHIQIGYLAMQERAFRQRHRTMTRAYALVQGRKLAHADDAGVHIGSVLKYVTDLESL